MDRAFKKINNFSVNFKAETEVTFFFFAPLSNHRHPGREHRRQEWVQGSWGLVLCGTSSPWGSGILLLLLTAVEWQCVEAAVQVQAKAAPLPHQASNEPAEVQVCLIIYGFSLDVENIC